MNPEFWQAFVPAMRARAAAHGIPNFHIFGEVYIDTVDVAALARHTRVDKLPAVLDFAFTNAVRATVAGNAGTNVLARLFEDDALYEGGAAAALQLPTFISNHDTGRFAWFVRKARPKASDAEVLQRVMLAHAMLLTLRGVPIVYYGDEQGFCRHGRRSGCAPGHVHEPGRDVPQGPAHRQHPHQANFDRSIRSIARSRNSRRCVRRMARYATAPRSFAITPTSRACSRYRGSTQTSGHEIVIAFNTSAAPLTAHVEVATNSQRFTSLHGTCAGSAVAPGSYEVTLAPLDFVVCAAGEAL